MPHKDPETRRAYLRAYKRRNAARMKQAVADSDRARHANNRAAKYGAPGRITLEQVRAILADRTCAYCGSREKVGIDHVIGLHAGGANEPANIVACCRACNASKWRADRPGRWSRLADRCSSCGTDERPHICHGLCTRCYARIRSHARRTA
jgi:5-methylcytosine-specific restriction endonuclease McrA